MSFSPGDILLNKYRIESLVGSGAFAEVYHATDLDLKVSRALKVLRKDAPGLGSSEFRLFEDRFQLEAQLGARFDHPNIVRVIAFERDGETLITVMEYCPGGSLASRIQEFREKGEQMPVDAVIKMGIEVAQGLAELHKLDIVHRDLKPSNILFDAQGRAKVADLGLAQTPESRYARLGMGSLSYQHPGTDEYMPPEQRPPNTDALRPSADVYALGCVLFEALTGRMYYHQKPGTRPSNLRKDAPGWLDGLIVRMLAEDAKGRLWDADEVVELLHSAIAEQNRIEEQLRIEEENQKKKEDEFKQKETEERIHKDQEDRKRREAEEAQRALEERRKREIEEKNRFKEQAGRTENEFKYQKREGNSGDITKDEVPRETAVQRRTSWGKNVIRVGLVLTILTIVGFLIRSIQQSSNSKTLIPANNIKIGLLAPISGMVPAFGTSTLEGVELAVKEWNLQGGVLGRTIELIVADSQCSADPAVNAANKLIDQDGVKYIIGEICSSASIPVSEITNQKGILQISPTSVNRLVTVDKAGKVKPFVFRACFIDAYQGMAMAKFARSQGFETAFIMVNQNNDYSKDLSDAFEESFSEMSGQIVDKATYNSSDTDFTAILAKVAEINPEILYLPDYYNIANLVAKQAKEMGIRAVMMGGDGWDSSDLDLSALDGSFFSNHYDPGDTRVSVQDWQKRYGAAYQDASGNPKIPDAIATLGYDATNILLSAIQQAGVDDPIKVAEVMSTISFNTVLGKFTFDQFHNPNKSVAIMGISNGSIQFIEPTTP